MAEQYLIYDDSLSSIGDAIRAKYGDTTKYYPKEMPEAIRGIPDAGGDEWWKLVDRTMQVFGDYEGLIYNIHPSAFNGCHQLESAYLLSTAMVSFSKSPLNSSTARSAFANTPMTVSSYLGHYGSIYVTSTLIGEYKSASAWRSLSSRITGYAVPTGQRGSESNQYLIYDETLTNIGGAIRERLAEADEYYPRNMPAAIMRIGGSVDACGPIMAGIVNGDIESLDDTSGKATLIGSYAFTYIETLKSVRFPACTSLSLYAFQYCTGLEFCSFDKLQEIPSEAFISLSALHTVSFPVCETIGSYAFSAKMVLDKDTEFPACTTINTAAFDRAYCEAIHFQALPLWYSVGGDFVYVDCPKCTEISDGGFYYASVLERVSFPVCTTIGSMAFHSCSALTSVSFPMCTTISWNAFDSCYALESVWFDAMTEMPSSIFRNVSALHTVSFPVCETIGTSAFWGVNELDEDTEFPALISAEPFVFGAGGTSSVNTYCKAIHFPVLEYYPSSFGGNFVSVDCPECIEIGDHAFYAMSVLETVSFPACETIKSYAFTNCSVLQSMDFSVCKTIGGEAFRSCVSIQEANFSECVSLDDGVFRNDINLSLASFPVCEIIDFDAFRSCSALETAYFPSCISIDNRVFDGCNVLSSFDFTSCEYIGDYAFQSCSAIQSMSFEFLSYIGPSAFSNCASLSAIYLMSTSVVSAGGSIHSMFYGTPIRSGSGYIYVPANLYSAYCSASRWSNYSSYLSSI